MPECNTSSNLVKSNPKLLISYYLLSLHLKTILDLCIAYGRQALDLRLTDSVVTPVLYNDFGQSRTEARVHDDFYIGSVTTIDKK